MKDSKALFDNESADTGGLEDQVVASKSNVGPTLTLLETGQNPGAILKTARERLGLSVSEISVRTKINEKQLAAIESGDTSKFPPATFAKAFIKSYCKVVDLDSAPILLAFGFESPSAVSSKVSVTVDQGASAPRMPSNSRRLSSLSFDRKSGSKKFGLIAAIAIVVLFMAFYVPEFLSNVEDSRSVVSAEPSPVVEPVVESEMVSAETVAGVPSSEGLVSESLPLPEVSGSSASNVNSDTNAGAVSSGAGFVFPAIQEEQAKGANSAQPIASGTEASREASALAGQPANAKVSTSNSSGQSESALSASIAGLAKLRFVFSEESWVTVRDSENKVLMSQLNLSGSEATLEGMAPFKLVVGNADAVQLFVNGQSFDLTSKTRGEVARLVVE